MLVRQLRNSVYYFTIYIDGADFVMFNNFNPHCRLNSRGYLLPTAVKHKLSEAIYLKFDIQQLTEVVDEDSVAVQDKRRYIRNITKFLTHAHIIIFNISAKEINSDFHCFVW